METDHPFTIGEELRVPGSARLRRNSNENNNVYHGAADCLEEEVLAHHVSRAKTPVPNAFFRNQPHHRDDRRLNDDLTMGDAILGPQFRAFFSDVSVVGLKYVALGGVSWIRRFIWLILVLMGFGFMVYQVNNRVNHYLTWPTSVDVRINYNRTLRFPTVTICNENTVMKTMAQSKGLMDLVLDMMPPYPWPEYSPNFTLYEPFFQSLRDNNTDWFEIYKSYSHPLGHTQVEPSKGLPEGADVWGALIDCTYNRKRCLVKDFDVVPTNMGFCYQFNGAAFNLHTSRPGSVYGLQMLLYVGQVEYLASHSKSAGYRVLLHDPLETPLMLEWGFKVNPGHVNLVTFYLENVTQLGEPYGQCSQNETYRFTTCAQDCLAEYVVAQCDCQEFYFHHSTAPVCDLMERWQCVNVAKNDYMEQGLEEKCECPHQCHQKHYRYTVTAAQASDHVIDFMAKTVFAHMPYDMITTMPGYTVLSLLCDIGGAFGLVLGSTILTVVEFIDFLFNLCANGVHFYVAKKKDRARQAARAAGIEQERAANRRGTETRQAFI